MEIMANYIYSRSYDFFNVWCQLCYRHAFLLVATSVFIYLIIKKVYIYIYHEPQYVGMKKSVGADNEIAHLNSLAIFLGDVGAVLIA